MLRRLIDLTSQHLALKLLFTTLLFSMFIAIAASAWQARNIFEQEYKLVDSSMEVSATSEIIPKVRKALLQNDAATLQGTLTNLISVPVVEYAVIKDKSSSTILEEGIPHSDRGHEWNIYDDHGYTLGSLGISYDVKLMRENALSALPDLLLINSLKVAAIALFILIFVHFSIVRRLQSLKRLIKTANLIDPNDQSLAQFARLQKQDEIGQVVSSFFDLKNRLKILYQHLHQVNADLHSKITQQTITENSLRLSEERLRRVIASAPVILFVVDQNGRIQMFDGFSAKSLKLRIEDPVGFSVFDVFVHHDHFITLLHRALQGETFSKELKIGSNQFDVRFSPLYNPNNEYIGFIAVAVDVSGRVLHEQALVRAKKAAEQANDAKTQFIASVSHELRTPLGAILGFTELLEENLTNPNRVRYFQEKISRNAYDLLYIVNDILDLSKAESGQLIIEHQPTNLSEIFRDVTGLLQNTLSTNKTTLQVVIKSPIPEIIYTDIQRFKQILISMIGNAIKFSNRKPVTIELSFSPHRKPVDKKSGMLNIDVIDDGVGISKEDQNKIFKPFHQADANLSRRFRGSGLGLTISRRLATALGGNVKLISSSPGNGSKFRIRLECGNIENSNFIKAFPQTITATSVEEDKGTLADFHYLVVEDSEDNRILIKAILESFGARVTVATGGEEGLEKASQQDFSAIVMDIQMPDMDGYQATRWLREHGYDVPIIALTAHAMKGDREKALAAGCNAYLPKPINKHQLVTVLRSLSPSEPVGDEIVEKEKKTVARPTKPETPSLAKPPSPIQTTQAEKTKADQPLSEELPDDLFTNLTSEYEDDPRLFQIIQEFKERLPERIRDVCAALKQRDHDKLVFLAHQLKGATGGYGFGTLCKAFGQLEDDLRNQSDIDTIKNDVLKIIAQGRHHQINQSFNDKFIH